MLVAHLMGIDFLLLWEKDSSSHETLGVLFNNRNFSLNLFGFTILAPQGGFPRRLTFLPSREVSVGENHSSS